MLTIFSRLAAGEEMPAREKTRARRGRPAAHCPRRARRHPRRGIAFPQLRRLCARLGRPPAMLVLGAVLSAALLTAALAFNASGHNTCAWPTGTACPSPSIPQHADAGLSKRYGEKLAAAGLDFVVQPSMDEPTAGRVKVNGRDYRGGAAPMAGLGILLEATAMLTGQPARNHLPRFGARP